ncbi:diol dehydratase small subunit [Oenococcus oeni]
MSEIDQLVAKIVSRLQDGNDSQSSNATVNSGDSNNSGQELGKNDYPLYRKHPNDIKSPTGKNLSEITLENVINEKITSKDVRIKPDTLRMQGQIAKNVGRPTIQKNFQRAAELTGIPDDRILQMYNSLRPFRSSKQELLDIAKELRDKYHAPICANWFEEAAGYYEKDKKLKGDN